MSTPNPGDLFLVNRNGQSYHTTYQDILDSILENYNETVEGAQGPSGPQGPMGVTGPQGPRGATGAKGDGFTVVGTTAQHPDPYNETDNSSANPNNSVSGFDPSENNPQASPPPSSLKHKNDLGADVNEPAVGMCYVQPENSHLWMFAKDSSNATSWVDIGKIQGPIGPVGATGASGLTGPTGPKFEFVDYTDDELVRLTGATGSTGPRYEFDDLTDTQKRDITGATGSTGPIGATGSIAGLNAGLGIDGTLLSGGTVELKPAEFSEIGGVTEAPTNGQTYGRRDGLWQPVSTGVSGTNPIQTSGSNISLKYDPKALTVNSSGQLTVLDGDAVDPPIHYFFPSHITFKGAGKVSGQAYSKSFNNHLPKEFAIDVPRGANYAWVTIFFKATCYPTNNGKAFVASGNTPIEYSGRIDKSNSKSGGNGMLTAGGSGSISQNPFSFAGHKESPMDRKDGYAFYGNRTDIICLKYNSTEKLKVKISMNGVWRMLNCDVDPYNGTRVTIQPFYSPVTPQFNVHWA